MSGLPFTQPVNVRTLPKKGRREAFSASTDEATAIAMLYDLDAVETFVCRAEIAPWKGRGVRVRGTVEASIVQPCAITAEPLHRKVNEEFEALYVPEGSRLARPDALVNGELVLDAEGADPPEVFTGDSLDMAEIWLEHFALGLDPFARADDAELEAPEPPTDDAPNPFAALAALKRD
ncbi:MAG: DUF177 domain-containing protein [Pseudomonadota bacterium]